MELNINSPAYYTSQNGVIDEIYNMCKEIREYVKDKNYSELIDIIGITPIVAPKELLERGLFKETKKCEIRYRFASVSLAIDYDAFTQGDVTEKKKLIIENILKSMKAIQKRAKIDFDSFYADMKLCSREWHIES